MRFDEAEIDLRISWRRAEEPHAGSAWEVEEAILVFEARNRSGAKKELFRSGPLPTGAPHQPLVKVLSYWEDFQDYIAAMGWEEVRGHQPKFWYDHRYRRTRTDKP